MNKILKLKAYPLVYTNIAYNEVSYLNTHKLIPTDIATNEKISHITDGMYTHVRAIFQQGQKQGQDRPVA